PRLMVARDFPGAVDPLAILCELPGEALGELERRKVRLRALQSPDAAGDAHLVDPCDSAIVEVVLEKSTAALVRAKSRRAQPAPRGREPSTAGARTLSHPSTRTWHERRCREAPQVASR